MNVTFMLSGPGGPPSYSAEMSRFISGNRCDTGRHVFAYASLAGLEDAIGALASATSWQSVQKQWIIGIHNGITEPIAIEHLAGLTASEVRLFSSTGRIDMAALYANEKLHAKAIQLCSKDQDLIVLGSANATRAALGTQCTNYEAGVSVSLAKGPERGQFSSWFGKLWKQGIAVTPAIIDRYSDLRHDLLSNNRIVLPRLDEMPQAQIGHRNHLWIEAGAMSGGDRNQIEFGPGLATFFGPLRRTSVDLRLRWRGIERGDRPLSYKTTQWGTEIWRFSLITSNQGGPSFPDQIIHFTRHSDVRGGYFEIAVATPGSNQATQWWQMANRGGTIAWTGTGPGSGREYGIY